MKKSDLRTGMVVKDREGNYGVVLRNTATVDGIKWFILGEETSDMWEELDEYYNETLCSNFSSNESSDNLDDIVTIYQPDNFDLYTTRKVIDDKYIIWERKEPKYKIGDNLRFGKIRTSTSRNSSESVVTSHNGKAEIVCVYRNGRDDFFYTIKTTDGCYYTLTEKMIRVCE
jgi:hypothetical protein